MLLDPDESPVLNDSVVLVVSSPVVLVLVDSSVADTGSPVEDAGWPVLPVTEPEPSLPWPVAEPSEVVGVGPVELPATVAAVPDESVAPALAVAPPLLPHAENKTTTRGTKALDSGIRQLCPRRSV